MNLSASIDLNNITDEICPAECDNEEYSINQATNMPRTDNITKLLLYIEELKFAEINEYPKITEADVVSNIGGTLGLFLGLSLLSFVEIFEIIILLFST